MHIVPGPMLAFSAQALFVNAENARFSPKFTWDEAEARRKAPNVYDEALSIARDDGTLRCDVILRNSSFSVPPTRLGLK